MKPTLVLGCLGLVAAACTTTNPGVEGTQSLRVELMTPADPGSPEQRLADSVRDVTVRVTALDEQGEVDAGLSREVDVFVQFLGGLTPQLGSAPLDHITLNEGVSGPATITLPEVFGPTYLWIEDGLDDPAMPAADDPATFATGTSPTLWFRDPFIEDIQRPADEGALAALSESPLQDKQVNVRGSRYGASGRLIITSTYAQGYTLSDVECQDAAGTPPCVAGDYDHVLVFSFSRPRDDAGGELVIGQAIDGFAGAVQEFNGLTEMGFPQTFVSGPPDVDLARLPPAVPVDTSWLSNPILFERNEAGLLELTDATICPLDDDYTTYKQWKVDIGNGCGDPINVITSGTVTDFDPATYVGQTLPSIIGTLRPVNIGSFNVWILFPRFSADLTLP
ncbi:MAG: hypothetical protein R2939_15730 [Kofleriaceae bacterium]